MIIRFIAYPNQDKDHSTANLLADTHALGLGSIQKIIRRDLFFIQGNCDPAACNHLAASLLSDPISQRCEWTVYPSPAMLPEGIFQVEVAFHPGVTDPVAEQLLRATHELGIEGIEQTATGQQYLIEGDRVLQADLDLLATHLLSNPVIQRYAIGEIVPIFSNNRPQSTLNEYLPIRGADRVTLERLSIERRAALDLPEMEAIQAYFTVEGHDPTDVEFETIAQTWSEHCVHKTFKARIFTKVRNGGFPYQPVIDNLFASYIKRATQEINAPWVLSAFLDNAGIIAFDDEFEVSIKVETHNHPSAIEPFGGANTGVGGVIRDIIGVSAKPIANTDILCFGPQDTPLNQLAKGVLHPRRVQSGVVTGVQDYGNKMGIPTVNGAIWYDQGYIANPLVFCGCVGIAPRNTHCREIQPGDKVILIGGRTGRDGIRGATFSSMTMDAQTGEVAGASVQIGDPIVEKGVVEVVLRARNQNLYHAITDCGAGGLSSAIGEMANPSGADIDLAQVRLKYPGLLPWEIWLSEAQERMVLAVPATSCSLLKNICDLFEVDYTDLGSFTNTGRLVVRNTGNIVLDLSCHFLHNGLPQKQLAADIISNNDGGTYEPSARDDLDIVSTLICLLSHPNIASKANIIRIYDHEVQGATVIKPLVGIYSDGPSDACVLKPSMTCGMTGIVISNGFNPEYGKIDPYRMALNAVDEAIRNAVAVGADPKQIALLDNFCWGDPNRPEVMGELVEAARGCYDAAKLFQTPFISGKDSFNNEFLTKDGDRQSIPATLLISAIGIINDVTRTMTMDLKHPGDFLYLIGDHRPVFGGSHFSLVSHDRNNHSSPPEPSWIAPHVFQAVYQAIVVHRLVHACHDISEGGLLVAASEMAIAGRLGLRLFPPINNNLIAWCFGETSSCFLVEVSPSHAHDFEALIVDIPCYRIGNIRSDMQLIIDHPSGNLSIPIDTLVASWKGEGSS